MSVLKLVAFDARNGIARFWWKYLGAAAVAFLFCLALSGEQRLMQLDQGSAALSLTLGDYMVNMVSIVPRYVFDTGHLFTFASPWMVTLLLAAYLTLGYPCRDLGGPDRQLVMAAGSRWAWWISKCVWVALSVLAFFLAMGVGVVLWTLVAGGAFSMELTPDVLPLIGVSADATGLWRSAAWIAAAALLVAVDACLVQLLVSLFVKPLLSLLVTIALLFLVAQYEAPPVAGLLLAALRGQGWDPGLQALVGVVAALAAMAAVVVAGGLRFKTMDIRGKDSDS